MTTAQDQQSHELLPCPFCGSPNVTLEHIQRSAYEAFCEFCGASGPCDSEQWRAAKGWNARALPARGVDPMLDTPASMKPVAEIFAGDLFRVNQGPDAEPVTGDHDLYTAAQVLAMGRVPPGWQAVPDASNMTNEQAVAIAAIANCCGGIAYDIYRAALAAAPRPPAAPTTEPQAPTTGAGSVTAGAAQKRNTSSDFAQAYWRDRSGLPDL